MRPISARAQDYQRHSASCEVLLVRDALVDGYQHIETGGLGSLQKASVFQTGEFGEAGRLAVLTWAQKPKDARRCTRLSRRALTMCHQQHSGFFQRLERPFTRNRRKTAKKLFQRVTALQVVEKGLDRNARAAEHGNSVHRFRISGNRLRHVFIVSLAR